MRKVEPLRTSNGVKKQRVFVAFPLPSEMTKGLSAWQERVLTKVSGRPVPSEGLHITFFFLGYLPQSDMVRLQQATESIAKSIPPFHIRLKRIQAGPPGTRPRLIWIQASSTLDLTPLRQYFQELLARHRIPCKFEARPFQPHLTLIRLERRHVVKKDQVFAEDITMAGSIENLDIMASDLARSGATYRTLKRFPLGGG